MVRIVLRLCIGCIAIIVALFIAELFLRFFKPQSTIDNVLSFYNYNCYKALPYYFVGLKPNSNCNFSSNENAFPPFNVKTNSLGLRNKEISESKAKNTKRILFVGDSFTFGLGVEDKNAFPRLVEKQLNQEINDENFETINAGIPASGPGYDYLFIKNTGVSLTPDIIIVGFYMQNDIPDMISHFWKKDENGLPTKIVSKSVQIDSGKMIPIRVPLKYSFPVLKHSHLFSLITNLLPSEITDPSVVNDAASSNDRIITPETCLYKSDCHTLDQVKKDTKRVYLEMKKIAVKNKIKLIVAQIPAPYQISPKSNLFTFNIFIPLLPNEKNYPYEEFESFFKKNGIEYIDPREELRKYKQDLYYTYDNHFNNAGHLAMAKTITNALVKYFRPTAASEEAKLLN